MNRVVALLMSAIVTVSCIGCFEKDVSGEYSNIGVSENSGDLVGNKIVLTKTDKGYQAKWSEAMGEEQASVDAVVRMFGDSISIKLEKAEGSYNPSEIRAKILDTALVGVLTSVNNYTENVVLVKKIVEPAKPSSESKKPEPQAEKVIKVKGFFVGMSAQECLDLVNKKYASEFSVGKPFSLDGEGPYKEAVYAVKNNSGFIFVGCKSGDAGRRFADVDTNTGAVTRLVFSPEEVNALFNANDMDAKAFAQQFMSSYGIPSMDTKLDRGWKGDSVGTHFEYTSPNGFKVVIGAEGSEMAAQILESMGQGLIINPPKSIIISVVPKAAERKFD